MSQSLFPQFVKEEVPQLSNPLLVLLSGENVSRKYEIVNDFFRQNRDQILIGQVSKGQAPAAEQNGCVAFSYCEKTQQLNVNALVLENGIRKMKQGRYQSNNDLTICLFLDSTSETLDWVNVCHCLNELFNSAYYDRVTLDVFYLLLENFVPGQSRDQRNREFAHVVSGMGGIEFVRYVFLVSDVLDDGQLIVDRDYMFQICMTVSYLVNSTTGINTISQLQSTLLREAEDGKFFALGYSGLSQPEQDIRQMVQIELTKQLLAIPKKSGYLPRNISFLEGMRIEINDLVQQVSGGTGYLAYYPCHMVYSDARLTYSDFLTLFFHEHPALYIEEVEEQCKKDLAFKVDFYWREIKAWLDEALAQSNTSICEPDCGKEVVLTVELALDNFHRDIQANFGKSQNMFTEWRNQFVQVGRFHRETDFVYFAYELLEQWRAYKTEEVAYHLNMIALSLFRERLKLWQEDMAYKCRLFSTYCEEQRVSWKELLRRHRPAGNYLLRYRKQEFVKFLEAHRWKLEACRNQLDGLLYQQIGPSDVPTLMSLFTEQFVHEGQMAGASWASRGLPDGENDPRMEEMFNALLELVKKDIPLHTRIHFPNSVSYLCFIGSVQEGFTKYVKQHGEIQFVFSVDSNSSLPGVFSFQHLSFGETFFWKELGEVKAINEI